MKTFKISGRVVREWIYEAANIEAETEREAKDIYIDMVNDGEVVAEDPTYGEDPVIIDSCEETEEEPCNT